MSVANDALLVALGQNGFPVLDDLSAPNTTQGTATRLTGQVSRFITSVAANAAAVLPSLNSLEAQSIVFMINDTPNSMQVFPATGETINALAANAAFTAIPAGQSAVFIKVQAASVGKGGGIVPGSFANNWRAAIIP